eukprot:TRINITY_DN21894_c0_g2_i3.p1 TRINITY_DN21894_c0_g2~~TRINITY_DN21894_c0_g2_i3.p1  ORF type:complete len:321 (+),score=106.36 TRINITY_DN21894_c0_g2_i3:87-965(+)
MLRSLVGSEMCIRDRAKKRREAREKIEDEFKDWQKKEEQKAADRKAEADRMRKQREAREEDARKRKDEWERRKGTGGYSNTYKPTSQPSYTSKPSYTSSSSSTRFSGKGFGGPTLDERVGQGAYAPPTARAKPPSPTAAQLGDPSQLWEKFVAASKNKKVVHMRDIPFPTKSSLSNMKFSDQKSRDSKFKKLAMRWHPDKFMQKYGKKLDAKEKDKVESRVKEVFQMMNSARNPSPEKGYSGYSGSSGYSGFSGTSGYSGYSGTSRSSYTSGFSGFGSNRYSNFSSNYSRFR